MTIHSLKSHKLWRNYMHKNFQTLIFLLKSSSSKWPLLDNNKTIHLSARFCRILNCDNFEPLWGALSCCGSHFHWPRVFFQIRSQRTVSTSLLTCFNYCFVLDERSIQFKLIFVLCKKKTFLLSCVHLFCVNTLILFCNRMALLW